MPDDEDDYESAFSLDGITDQESVSKNNWIGPDGTESGPDVPEDWYLTYDGPAPIVEGIYDENYAVDRGNGTVPVDFYIKKWGVPEGFGKTDYEPENRKRRQSESDYTPGEGTWAGLALFWVITLVVCTVSVFVTGWIGGVIAADLGTGDWTPVGGVITDSGVDTEVSQDSEGSSTTYCLWVEYEYTIENRTYDGDLVSYSKDGTCGSGDANADDEYPPGKNVTVYVNPENHEEAVLLTGLSGIEFYMCCFFIFPLVAVALFGLCCKATYNSLMYPEKYVVGNIVPDDTSTTLPSLDSDEDFTTEPHRWENGDHNIEEKAIQIGGLKIPVSALGTIGILLVVNVFFFATFLGENEYANEFNVATESMEGTSEWPSTTAVFSDNFTFWYDDNTGDDYFSGSIIIYCTQSTEIWECGDYESGYERIEIPYRCTENESVGPLQNPCDWAMKMFVIDSYHGSDSHYLEHWVVYFESEYCEWEGEPHDDNLWSCYYYNGETTEYDTWWQYCEHHLNESHWYCTDEFGEEASSPDNQNGTLYQPQEVTTTVNYDPESPSRIAFVHEYEWHSQTTSPLLFIIPFAIIINLLILGIRGVMPIVRMNRNIRG